MPTPSFQSHITDLCVQAAAQGTAAAVPGLRTRVWAIPSTYPVGIDVENPTGFISACSRDQLNSLAIEAYVAGTAPNSGRLGTVMAAKKAMDYQAAYERALHARHASAVRCRAWAGARRSGHGDATYGVFGAVTRDLSTLLAAATAVPNTDT